jgi:hypothetical protein
MEDREENDTVKDRKAIARLCLFEAISLVIIFVACRGNFWVVLLTLAAALVVTALVWFIGFKGK